MKHAEFRVVQVDRDDGTVLLQNLAMRGKFANVWALTDDAVSVGMIVRGSFDIDPRDSLAFGRFPRFTVAP